MPINSVQGSAAYTSTLNTTVPVDNTQPRNQNLEASQAALDDQTARVAQQAFEVTITQEARERLAQENEATQALETEPAETPIEAPAPEPVEAPSAEPDNTAPNTSPIVNIVA